MEKAVTFGSRRTDFRSLYDDTPSDVMFTFDGRSAANGDIELVLTMRNSSDLETRTVNVKVISAAVYYTGVMGEQLSVIQECDVLPPTKGETLICGSALPNCNDCVVSILLHMGYRTIMHSRTLLLLFS